MIDKTKDEGNRYINSFFGVVYGAFITWLSDLFFAIITGFGFVVLWYFLDKKKRKI